MASGSRSINRGSDETFLYECDVCKYMHNKTSEAISFCTVCTEYLCDDCDRTHKTLKATRDHKLVTGSNMPFTSQVSKSALPIMYCENHKSMTLNDYCITHRDVICGTCKLTDHRKCKTTDVTQQTQGMKINEGFDQTMERLTELKKIYEKTKKSRQTDKRKVTSEKKGCLDDVQKMRKRIDNLFDQLETALAKEASDVEEGMMKEIDNHVTIMDDALNQINAQLNSLDQCKKSQDDDVMFVGMTKAGALQKKYEVAITTIEQEIYPIQIEFKPNDVITDILMQLQSLGSVQTRKNSSHSMSHGPVQTKTDHSSNTPIGTVQSSKGPSHSMSDQRVQVNKDSSHSGRRGVPLKNMTVDERRNIDVRSWIVFDCTFIGDSHLVLACNDGAKLHDKHFTLQDQLCVPSRGVATIDQNTVIITHGYGHKQLQRVSIFPNMAVTQTLGVERDCYGIDIYNQEIYVTCLDVTKGNGEVRVLSMDGQLQRRIGVNDGQYMFRQPEYIKVSLDGSKLYVSDSGTGMVTCLSQEGRVLYQYSDTDLRSPSGMYVDEEGTVLVCGEGSHNIHMINPDGSKQKVLLSEKDDVNYPRCISYRQKDGFLVVGQGIWSFNNKLLLIFNTKMEDGVEYPNCISYRQKHWCTMEIVHHRMDNECRQNNLDSVFRTYDYESLRLFMRKTSKQ